MIPIKLFAMFFFLSQLKSLNCVLSQSLSDLYNKTFISHSHVFALCFFFYFLVCFHLSFVVTSQILSFTSMVTQSFYTMYSYLSCLLCHNPKISRSCRCFLTLFIFTFKFSQAVVYLPTAQSLFFKYVNDSNLPF